MKADIEYIQGAYKDAERPTGVEIALVYINIQRNVEDDLFAGADDKIDACASELGERNHEVSNRRAVEELVAEYNQVIQIGQDTIRNYYRNYRKIGKYIGLNEAAKDDNYFDAEDSEREDMTAKMQKQVNDLLASVRTDFWRRTLDLPEVRARLTSKKREQFEHQLQQHCHMDFTTGNIRQFVLNLMHGDEGRMPHDLEDQDGRPYWTRLPKKPAAISPGRKTGKGGRR